MKKRRKKHLQKIAAEVRDPREIILEIAKADEID